MHVVCWVLMVSAVYSVFMESVCLVSVVRVWCTFVHSVNRECACDKLSAYGRWECGVFSVKGEGIVCPVWW